MRKKTFIAVWHKIQRDGCKENANLCSYLKFVKKVAFFKKFGHSGCANFGKANSKVADILLFSKVCFVASKLFEGDVENAFSSY